MYIWCAYVRYIRPLYEPVSDSIRYWSMYTYVCIFTKITDIVEHRLRQLNILRAYVLRMAIVYVVLRTAMSFAVMTYQSIAYVSWEFLTTYVIRMAMSYAVLCTAMYVIAYVSWEFITTYVLRIEMPFAVLRTTMSYAVVTYKSIASTHRASMYGDANT